VLSRHLLSGALADGTFRFCHGGDEIGGFCMLGTFAERSVVSQHSLVKVPQHIPFESAVLLGCGAPTGWGGAVHAGGVAPGDTVVVYGVGGVGIHAVQGAAFAGAAHIIAVDPVAMKRAAARRLGATHDAADVASARRTAKDLTEGRGADVAVVATSVPDAETVRAAFDAIGRGGTVVVLGLSAPDTVNVQLPGMALVNHDKTVRGSLFGSGNPQRDIATMLRLYDEGRIELDTLVTARYRLDQINEGYADLLAGRNIRGIVVHAG
jgi:S-(hydroxymethyl)glutathione dehydrogenase/alcohol dehydrogenase